MSVGLSSISGSPSCSSNRPEALRLASPIFSIPNLHSPRLGGGADAGCLDLVQYVEVHRPYMRNHEQSAVLQKPTAHDLASKNMKSGQPSTQSITGYRAIANSSIGNSRMQLAPLGHCTKILCRFQSLQFRHSFTNLTATKIY